jgi:hypothetical protein
LSNVLRDSLKRDSFNLASPGGKDVFNNTFSGNLSALSTPTGGGGGGGGFGRNAFSLSSLPSPGKMSGLTSPSSSKQAVRSLARAKLSEIRAKQFLNQEEEDEDDVNVNVSSTPARLGSVRSNTVLAPLSEGAGSVASEGGRSTDSPITLPGLRAAMEPSSH